MKALITGSEGYIASNLKPFLVERSVKVKSFDTLLGWDLCNDDDLTDVLKGCDIVYNCAAISNIRECEENRDQAFKINVEGSRKLVKIATVMGVKPVLFSSDVIWGNTYYGKLKKQMEVENQERSVILRLTNVMGGLYYENKRNVIWHFMNDNPIKVYSSAGTVDFIHMNSVLESCWKAIEMAFGVYNVESRVKIPIKTLAYIFGAIRQVKVEEIKVD